MPDLKFDEKFVDKKTGETVTHIKVPEALIPQIEKHVNNNGSAANNFLAISRQIVDLQKKQMIEFDRASEAEKEIGVNVIKTREKMGLDSSWVYNIPLKSMEKREPPEVTLPDGVDLNAGIPNLDTLE